jgi:hypothetical protein
MHELEVLRNLMDVVQGPLVTLITSPVKVVKNETLQKPLVLTVTHKVTSNNLEAPPEIDSIVGLSIEPPSFESPQDQDHPIEGSESEKHSNPIEELENFVALEESLWGEKILNMGEEVETSKQKEPIMFEFPIQESKGILQMKNIMPYALPNFHGFPSEDPDTFLFEFDVLCEAITIIMIPINSNYFPPP